MSIVVYIKRNVFKCWFFSLIHCLLMCFPDLFVCLFVDLQMFFPWYKSCKDPFLVCFCILGLFAVSFAIEKFKCLTLASFTSCVKGKIRFMEAFPEEVVK